MHRWIHVRSTHEPIISENTWQQVQTLIAAKARCSNVPKEEGLFARKLRCKNCGYGMGSVKNGEKRGFQCSRLGLSRNACPGASISLRKQEGIVMQQLRKLPEEHLKKEGIPPKLTKEMVSRLVDFTEIGSKDPATGEPQVIIHWHF